MADSPNEPLVLPVAMQAVGAQREPAFRLQRGHSASEIERKPPIIPLLGKWPLSPQNRLAQSRVGVVED